MLIDMIRIVCQLAFDRYISFYPINYNGYGMISVRYNQQFLQIL